MYDKDLLSTTSITNFMKLTWKLHPLNSIVTGSEETGPQRLDDLGEEGYSRGERIDNMLIAAT